MAYLLKTEPDCYSFSDLEHDRETVWDGVTNPQAVKTLRQMQPGDKLVIYHTGDERSAIGTASVVSVDAGDPKAPLVRIKAGERFKEAKSLASIKAHALFATSPLLRQSRLSVVPLTIEQWDWLMR